MTVTRDQREELIREDDGPPETTVYTHRTGRHKSYHEDEDCSQIRNPSMYESMRRRRAQRQSRRPCRTCVDALEPNTENRGGPQLASAVRAAARDADEDPTEAALTTVCEFKQSDSE